MLDIRRVRTDFEGVLTALARRSDPAIEPELRRAVALDERLRTIVAERDELRGRINTLSKQVGTLRREGKTEEAQVIQDESRVLGEREALLAAEHDDIGTLLRETLLGIPNVPASEVPDGAGPEDNVVVETVGFDADSYRDHQRVPHWEIGVELGILDNERAAKLSGSMFALLPRPWCSPHPGAHAARARSTYVWA